MTQARNDGLVTLRRGRAPAKLGKGLTTVESLARDGGRMIGGTSRARSRAGFHSRHGDHGRGRADAPAHRSRVQVARSPHHVLVLLADVSMRAALEEDRRHRGPQVPAVRASIRARSSSDPQVIRLLRARSGSRASPVVLLGSSVDLRPDLERGQTLDLHAAGRRESSPRCSSLRRTTAARLQDLGAFSRARGVDLTMSEGVAKSFCRQRALAGRQSDALKRVSRQSDALSQKSVDPRRPGTTSSLADGGWSRRPGRLARLARWRYSDRRAYGLPGAYAACSSAACWGCGKSHAVEARRRCSVPRSPVSDFADRLLARPRRSRRSTRRSSHRHRDRARGALGRQEIEKASAAAPRACSRRIRCARVRLVLTWLQERTAPCSMAATAERRGASPAGARARRGRFDEVFFVDLHRRRSAKILARPAPPRRRAASRWTGSRSPR